VRGLEGSGATKTGAHDTDLGAVCYKCCAPRVASARMTSLRIMDAFKAGSS